MVEGTNLATLSDDEAHDIFLELTSALRDAGLGWVSEEVDQEIATGRLTTKTLPVPVEDFMEFDSSVRYGMRTPSPRRQVRFVSNEPYTATQRVSLLVRAIEHAVVGPVEMESEIFGTVKAANIQFASEVPGGPGYSFTPEALQVEHVRINRLRVACRDLRRLAEDDDDLAF